MSSYSPTFGRLTQPASRAVSATSATGGLSIFVAAYLACLPFLVEVDTAVRVGIADAFLFLYVLFNAGNMKVVRNAWSFWHLAMAVSFVIALMGTALREGALSSYSLLNKSIGFCVLMLTYLVLTSELRSWRRIIKAMRVFVIVVTAQNLIAMGALFLVYTTSFRTDSLNYGNERLCGWLYDPNAYGGLLLVALAFNRLSQLSPVPLTRGLLRTLCDASLTMGVIFTFSRGAWLALALIWVLMIVLRPKSSVKLMVSAVAAASVAAVFIASGLLDPDRVVGRANTIGQRVELMNLAVTDFSKSPWFGLGLGRFWDTHSTIVHNTLLWFLADFGLIGFGIAAGFLGYFFWLGLRVYRRSTRVQKPYVLAFLVANAAMLALSMSIEAFYQRHWWMIFALTASVHAMPSTAPAARRRDPVAVPDPLLAAEAPLAPTRRLRQTQQTVWRRTRR